MVKRRRNKIGQFVSASYLSKEQDLNFENFFQKVFRLLVALLVFFMLCPWLTIAFKSKTIKGWFYGLIEFFNYHFIGDEGPNEAIKCSKGKDEF